MYPIHTLSFYLTAQVHMQGSRRDVRYSNVLEYIFSSPLSSYYTFEGLTLTHLGESLGSHVRYGVVSENGLISLLVRYRYPIGYLFEGT